MMRLPLFACLPIALVISGCSDMELNGPQQFTDSGMVEADDAVQATKPVPGRRIPWRERASARPRLNMDDEASLHVPVATAAEVPPWQASAPPAPLPPGYIAANQVFSPPPRLAAASALARRAPITPPDPHA